MIHDIILLNYEKPISNLQCDIVYNTTHVVVIGLTTLQPKELNMNESEEAEVYQQILGLKQHHPEMIRNFHS